MGRDAKTLNGERLRMCEACALHTRGSRLWRFAPSANVRKRLFRSLESNFQCHDLLTFESNKFVNGSVLKSSHRACSIDPL